LTTTQKQVDSLCGSALSKELMCWCYNSYARTCPIESGGQ
jgi:hypothetical protein